MCVHPYKEDRCAAAITSHGCRSEFEGGGAIAAVSPHAMENSLNTARQRRARCGRNTILVVMVVVVMAVAVFGVPGSAGAIEKKRG